MLIICFRNKIKVLLNFAKKCRIFFKIFCFLIHCPNGLSDVNICRKLERAAILVSAAPILR